MYKFHCLNPIAEVGLNQFTGEYEAEGKLEGVDAVLVRALRRMSWNLIKS